MDHPLVAEQLKPETIGSDSPTPDIDFTFHFLDITMKWIAWKILDCLQNPFAVLALDPRKEFENRIVNL